MFNFLKTFIPAGARDATRALIYARRMELPQAPRVFIFLAADYGNIGDLAITKAQSLFLSRTAPRHQVVPIPISATREVLRSLRMQVVPSDIVTIIGGGNMGSMYSEIEQLRQLVIHSFPRNRVVCFPQTFDWDDSRVSRLATKRIVQAYSRHPDIHLFARESISHAKLQELFGQSRSVKVGLVPDIVLSATGSELRSGEFSTRRGALLCLRSDRERSLDDEQQESLRSALTNAGLHYQVTDTHVGGSRFNSEHCSQLLSDKANELSRAQLVVTDRLHGMILAALVGTPCLVLPNSNHKIRQTWQDWLAKISQIRFLAVEELPKVDYVVQELLTVRPRDSVSTVVPPSHYAALSAAVRQQ